MDKYVSSLEAIEEAMNNEKEIKDLGTELISVSEILKNFRTNKWKLPKGQRKPNSAPAAKVNYFLSTIFTDKKSTGIPNIIIGLVDGQYYIVDGLQRISTLEAFCFRELGFKFVKNNTPYQKPAFYNDLDERKKLFFDNVQLKVEFKEYEDMEDLKEHIHHLNVTSTPMTSDEETLIYTSEDILDFLEKADKKAGIYKFEHIMPLTKNPDPIFSDRSKSMALNVECFLMATFTDDVLNSSESLTAFKRRIMSDLNGNRSAKLEEKIKEGKRTYTMVREIMKVLAANCCNCKITRYRSLWIALCNAAKHREDGLGSISSNLPELFRIQNNGTILDSCEVFGRGNSKSLANIKKGAEFITENMLNQIPVLSVETEVEGEENVA